MRSSKADESGRVALPVHQERERGGEHGAVFHLAHRRGAAVAIDALDIEQQMALEVGLLLEPLDVMPVAARVDLPVDGGQIVARQVLPVLGELDAEPLVRTAMQPRHESLDHRPRLQLHRPQPRKDRRDRETGGRAVVEAHAMAYIPLRGRGTASSSRSTSLSAVMRSDSA